MAHNIGYAMVQLEKGRRMAHHAWTGNRWIAMAGSVDWDIDSPIFNDAQENDARTTPIIFEKTADNRITIYSPTQEDLIVAGWYVIK